MFNFDLPGLTEGIKEETARRHIVHLVKFPIVSRWGIYIYAFLGVNRS